MPRHDIPTDLSTASAITSANFLSVSSPAISVRVTSYKEDGHHPSSFVTISDCSFRSPQQGEVVSGRFCAVMLFSRLSVQLCSVGTSSANCELRETTRSGSMGTSGNKFSGTKTFDQIHREGSRVSNHVYLGNGDNNSACFTKIDLFLQHVPGRYQI